MRKGGSKAKGADFERWCCRMLSQWVTRGARDDVFWRAALSGGRATNRFKRGSVTEHQAGDISAVHEAGNAFASYWFVECKHIKDLNVQALVLGTGGPLATYWTTAKREAAKYRKHPMVIAKQNFYPVIALVSESEVERFSKARLATVGSIAILDFEKMTTPVRHRVRI